MTDPDPPKLAELTTHDARGLLADSEGKAWTPCELGACRFWLLAWLSSRTPKKLQHRAAPPAADQGLVASGPADVWLRAVGGELAKTAAMIGLRCRDGEVEDILAGGASLRLAWPGCPPEFHLQLLAQLARARRIYDDQWIVIMSPEIAADGPGWTCATAGEPPVSS